MTGLEAAERTPSQIAVPIPRFWSSRNRISYRRSWSYVDCAARELTAPVTTTTNDIIIVLMYMVYYESGNSSRRNDRLGWLQGTHGQCNMSSTSRQFQSYTLTPQPSAFDAHRSGSFASALDPFRHRIHVALLWMAARPKAISCSQDRLDETGIQTQAMYRLKIGRGKRIDRAIREILTPDAAV